MGLAILLFLVFAGIEDAPLYGYNGDYPTDGLVKTYAFPLPGTTWVACSKDFLSNSNLCTKLNRRSECCVEHYFPLGPTDSVPYIHLGNGTSSRFPKESRSPGRCFDLPLHCSTFHWLQVPRPVLHSTSIWIVGCRRV